MQAGGRSTTDSRERFALRRALVVVQVALSLVLIVGALLFGRSLRNLVTRRSRLPAGRHPRGQRRPPPVGDRPTTRTGADLRARHGARARRRRRDARRRSVHRADERLGLEPERRHRRQRDRTAYVNFNRVGADYFRTMGTPLIAGRPFGAGGPARRGHETAIVNESFAQKYFGGAEPDRPGLPDRRGAGRAAAVTTRSSASSRTRSTPICARTSRRSATSLPRRRRRSGRSSTCAAHPTCRLADADRRRSPAPFARSRPESTVAYDSRPHLRPRLAGHRAADGDALRVLRAAGDADRDDRPLRRDVVHGVAPQGGDRDPHGARRRLRAASSAWCSRESGSCSVSA